MTPSQRSREATRARLLDAARIRFQDQGFDATTVREIASDAGVDPALVMRYFGTKEGLFAEITLTEVPVVDVLEGDRATLGHRLALLVLNKKDQSGIETVLRSLGVAGVSARCESEMHDQFVAPLAKWLGGRDALLRAGAIVSMLNGLTLSLAVLEQRSLVSANRTTTGRLYGNALQTIIDPA
jgi:AcrR family transcriptional regulator